MRDVLQEPGAREQHVIHLGDVYYSGWPGEYQKRFLAPWPVDTAKKDQIGSWILNGNHDMYSGGKGFWETALADPRFHRQQNYSYFCLENDHWKIFGLDTAYDDHALKDPQAAWVKAGMDAAPGKQILLFSHHQPFSAYEKGGPKLVKKLNAVLNTGRITAWFWGHEHRCVLYDGHQKVGFGRCIGHGGVPVYMNHSPGEQVPSPGNYEYRATMGSDGLFPWARFGFAILDFEDATIHVRYLDELGDPYHSETIPATAPPAGPRRAPRRR
jgi:hypothetical protein